MVLLYNQCERSTDTMFEHNRFPAILISFDTSTIKLDERSVLGHALVVCVLSAKE